MTHDEKVQHFLVDAAHHGIWPATAAPPLWRFVWLLRLKLPPPHFMGFFAVAVLLAVVLGIFWFLVFWAVLWRSHELGSIALMGAAAGVLLGCLVAVYYRV